MSRQAWRRFGQRRQLLTVAAAVLAFGSLGFWLLNLSTAAPDNTGYESGSGQHTGSPSPARSAGSPTAINGALRVCGVQLCNQYGRPVQLRGMSTHGIQWYGWGDCINPASIEALATDWNADVLRISQYVQEGGYETDPAGFTAMADTIIDAAIDKGMYVLIDWHQLTPGDPNYNTALATAYFSHMAARYKDKPNILYEIANEPNGVSWSGIRAYAGKMVPLIRSIDPDNIIIIGTPAWDTFGLSDEKPASEIYDSPVSGTNLMYSFHFYAADHGAEYRARLDEASSRLPVFVTEWGTQEDTGDGRNDFKSAQQFVDLMARKKISWTSWNYSDDERSGAAFTPGTCPGGPYTGSDGGKLKPAGSWVRERIRTPADDFPAR
jgi:endoglucanase